MRVSWVTGHASQAPAVRFRQAVFADSQPGEAQAARWQVGGSRRQRILVVDSEQDFTVVPSNFSPKTWLQF